MSRLCLWIPARFSSGLFGLLLLGCGASDPQDGPSDGAGVGGADPGTGGTVPSGGTGPSGGTASGGAPQGGGPGAGGSIGGGSGGIAGGGGIPMAGGGMATGGDGGTVQPQTGGASSEESPTAEVAAAMGRGVNLGQMFESTQHPRTLAAATAKIDAYYARGFRNVRIPVTWTEAIGGDRLVNDPLVGDVNRSHPRLQVIESVVDYALSKPDLYVVINAHHEAGLKTNSRAQVLERLWQDISDIFSDRDHRLLFEVLNEPHRDDGSAMPAADLREMTRMAYAKIRDADEERIVIIGGNQWFGAHEMPEVWTDLEGVGGGDDPYVMATFHHYDPWTFCGDNEGDYADEWTEANQSDPMEEMAAWANSVGKGMPVYIGEWGVGWGSRYSTMTCNNIRKWYTSFDSTFASQQGQPTAVWDDGGWFMIFNHASNSFANNLIDCIEGACDWDGSERFNPGCD